VFGKTVPRRILELKTEEVTEEWRNLHDDKLHNLYPSPTTVNVIKLRRMRWMGHIALVRETRNAYKIVIGKLEGKGQLERPMGRRY
jgi:hypothetical protein